MAREFHVFLIFLRWFNHLAVWGSTMAVEDLDVWIQLRTDPATGCDGCRNLAHGWRCALQQLSIQQCIIHLCYNLFIFVLFSQMGPFFQEKMSTLLGTITYHPLFFQHFGSRWWIFPTSPFRWDMWVDPSLEGSFCCKIPRQVPCWQSCYWSLVSRIRCWGFWSP